MTQNKTLQVIGAQGYLGTGVCALLDANSVEYEAIDIRKAPWNCEGATELVSEHDVRKWDGDDFADVVIFLAGLHMEPEGLDSAGWAAWYDANSDIHNAAFVAAQAGKRVIFTSSSQIWVNPESAYARIKQGLMEDLLSFPDAATLILGTVAGGPLRQRPQTFWNAGLLDRPSNIDKVRQHIYQMAKDAGDRRFTWYDIATEAVVEEATLNSGFTVRDLSLPGRKFAGVFCDYTGDDPIDHPTKMMADLLDLPHPDRKA